MSDEFPREPRLPSIPKGVDRGPELVSTKPPPRSDAERLMHMLAETQAAAANLGALVTELRTALACTQLALLTEEHKANHAHERIDELAKRVEALEPQAAE